MTDSFVWPVRVYYEDTDVGGVVYYANYLKFFERARTEMLRNMGYEQDELIATQGVIFAVRSAQIEYLSPAKFNDLLDVSAVIEEVRPASLTFRQGIVRAGVELCKGKVRIACLDSETLRPKIIPDELLDKLKK
ncbi:MAG: tol-pal system-associated acyl-CoA thioesterase [Gammaproteobacteria bacterium]